MGNLTQVTDAESFERLFDYDQLDRLIRLTEVQIDASNDAITEFAYDAAGNLTAITDAQEVEIKHFLDSLTCLQVMGEIASSRVVDV